MKRITVLFFITLFFFACNARRDVIQVWDYVQDHPDSALVSLNVIDESSLHGRTLAEYRLLKAMALDKSYVNVSSDSLARPAYEFFKKRGPKEKELMSLYYLAVSNYYAHNDAQAIVLLDNTIELAKQTGSHYYAGLAYILKSHAFSRTFSLSEAVTSAELGVMSFEAIPDSFQVNRAKIRLADAYHSKKEYDKAAYLYLNLSKECQKDTFAMRRILIHGAYNMYLLTPLQPDSAMVFYERALRDYSAVLDPVEAAHFAEVTGMAGDIQQAHQIAGQLKLLNMHPEQLAYLDYRLFERENNPEEALNAVDRYLDLQDSILSVSLEQSLVRIQRNYQEQLRKSSERTLFLTRMLGVIGVLFLLLILLAVSLYSARKIRTTAKEKEELIDTIGKTVTLLQETEIKNTDLENSLQIVQKKYVSAYKKQFSKISTLIEKYYSTSGRKDSRDIIYRQVMDIAATIGNDQTRVGVLERDVNAALDNAMKWYRIEFPNRDSAHYNMVCFFMAGFSTPMIELLTRIPKNTLYSKKSRLLDEIRRSSSNHKDLFILAIM
jgi:hypothetical protein